MGDKAYMIVITADTPNRKRLTDITQVSCRDGKPYIAQVLDCCNGKYIGFICPFRTAI